MMRSSDPCSSSTLLSPLDMLVKHASCSPESQRLNQRPASSTASIYRKRRGSPASQLLSSQDNRHRVVSRIYERARDPAVCVRAGEATTTGSDKRHGPGAVGERPGDCSGERVAEAV